MGTKMPPSYANTCMGKLEHTILSTSLNQPLSWFRFIDDVDMKWNKSQHELDIFIQHANSAHPSIKFTHEISSEITFLDTKKLLKGGRHILQAYRQTPIFVPKMLSSKTLQKEHSL